MQNEFVTFDYKMMTEALHLAKLGQYTTTPNPRVGCVIVKDRQIVGRGYHHKAGEPHAEVLALKQAGSLAHGSDVYVTLEPCSHYGRTPPCAKGLIDAGVQSVTTAMIDPNPLVSGQGLAMLESAGIRTRSGLLEEQARHLNRGFLSRIERQRPFIRLKYASSLDGRTALKNGISQWISGEKSRADVQNWRASSCAIMTGIGTILADNPRLNVRLANTERQPVRIILDSQLRTPAHSFIIQDSHSPTWIITTQINKSVPYGNLPHIKIFRLPENTQGHIDLTALMPLLAQEGIGEVLVEAGSTLNGALIQACLVDELLIYLAPIVLGHDAQAIFRLPELTHLDQASQWQIQESIMIGEDIRLILTPKG